MADKYYFLNVGCADCTIMHIGNKIVMVDCRQGNSYENEANILDYIPNKHIDVLICTHQHYDHFDGIQVLLDNNISVGEIWESNYERRYGDSSVEYEEWQNYQQLVAKLNTKIYHPTRSTEIFDRVGGASFQFYNPIKNINDSETRELHDASLVFTLRKGKMSVTFTGDASDWALEQVTNYFTLQSKHVLHASHHGSINGAYLEFIKKINPNYTIISTKSGVYSNVPHPTALQRYKSYTNEAVRRTDVDGTRVFTMGE